MIRISTSLQEALHCADRIAYQDGVRSRITVFEWRHINGPLFRVTPTREPIRR